MFLKRYLILVVLNLALLNGFSQEYVVPLIDNPVLPAKTIKSNKLKKAILQDTLSLPFFDDFSGSLSPYPKPALWLDSFVYINDSYAVKPLSIGVATFDAIDQYGKIYKNASEKPFYADALTSRPINLNYPATSNVFLSFFYQPQGLGDNTEVRDSLLVDFYNPASKRWYNAWQMKGSGLHSFKAVIIPITADSFLVKGFQFRFRNIASILKNNFIPGKMGDVDHWNIDYVKLDINRSASDTIMRDVAFTKPMTSLLNNYQSMPWKHFQRAFTKEMRQKIDITYRNNDTATHKPDRYFEIREINGTNVTSFYGGNENIMPDEVFHFTTNLEYPFESDKESVNFEVRSFLKTEPYDIKINDTARFIQVFSNYFAYDDGSPEYGYGLSGQGTTEGKVAYKFTSAFADTLTAVKIFFNSTLNEISKSYYFNLTVWKAGTSGPGDTIYRSELQAPKDLGKYTTYILDTGLLVNGDFYVGWEQPNENFLNIGLDRNNSATERLFFNVGSWQKSAFDSAALMIRPVFGYKGLISGKKELKNENFRIYPNPTYGIINIERSREINGNLYATLLNITGKIMLQSEVSSNTLNLGDLPTGIYFLILTEDGQTIYKSKVLVQH